ncbi:MAG: hypothetical protein A2583_05405 [Bdellovibrionales bacterium RIFOXYD1_FULL_53_11]|nr:MAG: hypothetical protein A2583_05405 [Bdellovibrionales bacterium RIFOXYD1_FULL_53_11]
MEIKFVPLTDGLGFHPFSDGLPYAPVSKPRIPGTSHGTGAVAAGKPVFLKPPVTGEPPTILRPAKTELLGIGYLARRVVAFCFDSAINITLCFAALAAVIIQQNAVETTLMNPSMLAMLCLLLLLTNWCIITAQEVAFGATPGKRLLGLAVDGTPVETLKRSLFFAIGTVFCGTGLAWALFNPKRQCWHDAVTGIQPVDAASL